ncbi:TlpA disulfide reductase family protein [Ramlibacter sp.]|uniref:TlpA family protein disulfide reductase n=1 Tax=Ramlibacter sp. TaxID=1917967 RepID=UPI002C54E058|nr:TlpA disulfide reductase family protein [Ramlibacter sp.]HWI82978.1 TlpA disulfide reductase family protein [Ramlibacter sp.]
MKAVFLALLLGLVQAATPALAKTPGEVEVGATLREATMQGLAGPSRKLSEYRGKPLIINVWASWCGPCREEMGSLQRLARRYGGRQFNVIGISTDDYVDRAEMFLRVTNTTAFRNFIDQRLFLEHMLGAERLPLTLLVDANGKVLAKYVGAKEWDSPPAIAAISKAFGVKL